MSVWTGPYHRVHRLRNMVGFYRVFLVAAFWLGWCELGFGDEYGNFSRKKGRQGPTNNITDTHAHTHTHFDFLPAFVTSFPIFGPPSPFPTHRGPFGFSGVSTVSVGWWNLPFFPRKSQLCAQATPRSLAIQPPSPSPPRPRSLEKHASFSFTPQSFIPSAVPRRNPLKSDKADSTRLNRVLTTPNRVKSLGKWPKSVSSFK